MYDGTEENEAFEYNINGVPYTGEIGEELPTDDVKLTDAAPDKYLVLYSVKEEGDSEETKKFTITKFSCVPLKDNEHDTNWLLQYPCSINVYIEGGKGTMLFNNKMVNSINTNVEYDGTFELYLEAAADYSVKNVTVANADTGVDTQVITQFETLTVNGQSYQGVKLENITVNSKIKVLFEVNE